jgi:lipopolysaccharide/colanic/teichoic acid biosynthesis glycosyltransferase
VYSSVKSVGDRVVALTLLTLSLPILLLTALLVRVKLGSPVLFRQERPTKDGEIFRIFKFRTMSDQRDSSGELLPDEVRLQGVGKAIRSLSLDELPQLLNVLRGEMSFIGPRPLLPEYLPLYSPYQYQRHSVKAGITGLAQVKGRNSLSWRHRFRYDVFYVKNRSLKLDIYITLLTLYKVFKRSGVNSENGKTMEKFTG